MNLKNIIYLLATVLMIGSLGCSSAPKSDNNSSDGSVQDANNTESPSNSTDETEVAAPKDEIKAEVPVQPVSNETYRKFNDARRAGQVKQAHDYAGEILARNPNDFKVLNALAVLAIQQGKYDLARLLSTKALAKNPNNSAVYNNLGVIELKTDNLRLALIQFKRALEMDSRNKSAHANLGTIYLQYRNYNNAVTELEAATDNGDKSPETYNNLAVALAGAGQYEKALNAYEFASEKNPNDHHIQLNYAALLVEKVNRPKRAIKVLNKLRFAAREPDILERVNQLAKKADAAAKSSSEKE